MIQNHSTRNSTAGSSEATQKTTNSSFSTSDKYEKLRSRLGIWDEICPDSEDPSKIWIIKRNGMGDIVDLYWTDESND